MNIYNFHEKVQNMHDGLSFYEKRRKKKKIIDMIELLTHLSFINELRPIFYNNSQKQIKSKSKKTQTKLKKMAKTLIKNQENSLKQHPSIDKTPNEQNHLSCLPSTGNPNSSEISISNILNLSRQISEEEGRKVAEIQKDLQKLNEKKSKKNQKKFERNLKKKAQNIKIKIQATELAQVQNRLQVYRKIEANSSYSSNLCHHETKLSQRKNAQQKKKGKDKKANLMVEQQSGVNLDLNCQVLEENHETQSMRIQSFQRENEPAHSLNTENHLKRESVVDISLQRIEQSDRDFQKSNSHSESQSSLQNTERLYYVRKPLDRKSSDCSIISTSSEISRRGNDASQPVRFKKKDIQSYIMENQRIKFPPFPNKALEFKFNKFFKKIKKIRFGTSQKISLDYSLHENKTFPQKERNQSNSKSAHYFKTVKGWKILCINCDFNKPSGGRIIDNKYYQTDPNKRADQIVRIIVQAMRDGVDFILLQEACTGIIRSRILKELKQWNNRKQLCTYYYPSSLEEISEQRTTLILSRHKGQFGQLGFQIEEFPDQDTCCFPKQAYFKFEIFIDGKKETVCILCCHLRSNAPPKFKSFFTPTQVRTKQFQCIENFGQTFDQFFSIGDTNVPNCKQENSAVQKSFDDAIYLGAQDRGTYLFRISPQQILNERLDRVLRIKKNMRNKRNMRNVVVNINYRDDILLDCCQQIDLTQKEMLRQYPKEIIQIRPTDHAIMGITICYKA